MLITSTYLMLFLSVVSLWFKPIPVGLKIIRNYKIQYWQLFICITLIFGFLAHVANILGIIILLSFYFLLQIYHYCTTNDAILKKWYFILSLWFIVVGYSCLIYLHYIPGFNNLLIWDHIKFTKSAIPFTMYLNLDKVTVAIFLFGTSLTVNQKFIDWKSTFKAVVKFFPVVVIVLLSLTYCFNYIRFEPKMVNGLFMWAINNLFFVCFAEEALFRGFIQNSLSSLSYKYSNQFAIIIAGILFGLLHIAGGYKYVILATLAGFLYGYIYHITKKIEVNILTHFLVNFTHIMLFTYPALA